MTDANARKELLRRTFDGGAQGYADIRYFRLYAARLVELTRLWPGAKVLDVASGRGAVLFAVAEQLAGEGHVLGVDLSPEMARATAADIEARGVRNASTAAMDAEALDLPGASFDAVLCAFSMQFFPRLDRALVEFRRVLRPGGLLAVSTWGADDPAWDWYGQIVARYGIKVTLRAQSLDTPQVVRGWLSDAGFTDVSCVVEEPDFVYADADEWWITRWNLSCRAELQKLDAPTLDRFTAEVNERLEAMRQPDGFHELQEVIYTLARASN